MQCGAPDVALSLDGRDLHHNRELYCTCDRSRRIGAYPSGRENQGMCEGVGGWGPSYLPAANRALTLAFGASVVPRRM